EILDRASILSRMQTKRARTLARTDYRPQEEFPVKLQKIPCSEGICATAAYHSGGLQGLDARQLAAFEPFEKGSAGGRDISHRIAEHPPEGVAWREKFPARREKFPAGRREIPCFGEGNVANRPRILAVFARGRGPPPPRLGGGWGGEKPRPAALPRLRRRQVEAEVQFLEPLGGHRRRRAHHQVTRLLVHRE